MGTTTEKPVNLCVYVVECCREEPDEGVEHWTLTNIFWDENAARSEALALNYLAEQHEMPNRYRVRPWMAIDTYDPLARPD